MSPVKAVDERDLHRPLESGLALEEVLCVHEERVVGHDWCVRWQNRWLQIGKEHAELRLAGRRVRIKQLADGRLMVEHGGRKLSFTELAGRPAAPKPAKKVVVNNRKYKPRADHPWNRETAVVTCPLVSPAPAAPARGLPAGGKKKAG